jgi:hypothetical protein
MLAHGPLRCQLEDPRFRTNSFLTDAARAALNHNLGRAENEEMSWTVIF